MIACWSSWPDGGFVLPLSLSLSLSLCVSPSPSLPHLSVSLSLFLFPPVFALLIKVSRCSNHVTSPTRLKRNDTQTTTLKSKIQMLEVRMEAQKDLLRQDASAAVESLEKELAAANEEHEACKQELAAVEDRANKLAKDLQIAEGDVGTLERTRDRLTAERDEQASRLDALESAQERSERDLDELQEALSSATSELMVLREAQAACDRIQEDLINMRGHVKLRRQPRWLRILVVLTVEVVVVEGKGETTVVTPSRRNKTRKTRIMVERENLLVPRRWRNGWHHGVVERIQVASFI